VVVRSSDVDAVVHAGGNASVTFRTFDIEAPALEEFLREKRSNYEDREVIGVELLPAIAAAALAKVRT
jgi:hypothetical protein